MPPYAAFSLLLFTVFTGSLFASDKAPVPSPWEQASLSLFQEAKTAFAALPAGDREARLGEAVTLLNVQPKTADNLDQATRLLKELIAVNSTDDIGISSHYFLARIAQIHRLPVEPVEARRLFRELIALKSAHPLAQRAVVNLAILDLYEVQSPEELRNRFNELAALGAGLTDRSARRDFHLVMGDAAQRLELGEDLALDHLLAADREGLARITTRGDTWIRIAELARRNQRNAVAITYYNKFLENFLRDSRRVTVKERLSALGAPATSNEPQS